MLCEMVAQMDQCHPRHQLNVLFISSMLLRTSANCMHLTDMATNPVQLTSLGAHCTGQELTGCLLSNVARGPDTCTTAGALLKRAQQAWPWH